MNTKQQSYYHLSMLFQNMQSLSSKNHMLDQKGGKSVSLQGPASFWQVFHCKILKIQMPLVLEP